MFQKKQVFKLNILKKLLDDENACVSLVPTTRVLALPPFFLNDMKSGILYLLNYMLKKYDRSLGGIVIGYQNIKVLMDENTGIIPMGTAEIEVNISVEFYIFQPKIGSFLEGIVNKKSNNHIGCLVHQFFNATILKPEDVEFDDWTCKDFNVDDKIIFKVKDLDFTTLLPYIEGVIEENFQKESSKCMSEMSDVSDVRKDVQDVTLTQKLLTRLKSDGSDGKHSENTKISANEEKLKSLEMSLNRLTNSQSNTKKEDKKKRESGNKKQKGQSPIRRELTADCDDVEIKSNESFSEKRKKKKKEKEKEKDRVVVAGSCSSADPAAKEQDKLLKLKQDCFSLEKCVSLEDEDSSDFVGPLKSKNEKKKKKMKENESLNETLECQPSRGEDNVFSSTQLEPKSKMTDWFCSPIPRGMPSGTEDGKNVRSVSDLSLMQDSPNKMKGMEKDKKKKHKKRSREEEEEVDSVLKKIKMSEADSLMEELWKKQVNRAVKDLKESEKMDREGKKNAKKMWKQNEESMARVSNVNGSGKTSNEHDTFCELSEQNLSGQKESSAFGKDSVGKESKVDARNKSVKVKKSRKDKPDEVGSGGEEKKTAKESTDNGGKKPKTAEKDREENDGSLYKKILEKAKNEILEKYKPSTSSPTRDSGKLTNKKDSELPDLSLGSSKSKHSRKKTKHQEKVKDGPGTREEFKNGSMYDLPSSPEKPDYDKSLFTDSEQSQASPAKKRKQVNGIGAGETPREQNKSNIFCTEQTATTKSESDREVCKHLKKSKAKRKPESPAAQRESLFEKLLEQARRLIDIKEESPCEKGKSGRGSKKVGAPSEDLKP